MGTILKRTLNSSKQTREKFRIFPYSGLFFIVGLFLLSSWFFLCYFMLTFYLVVFLLLINFSLFYSDFNSLSKENIQENNSLVSSTYFLCFSLLTDHCWKIFSSSSKLVTFHFGPLKWSRKCWQPWQCVLNTIT